MTGRAQAARQPSVDELLSSIRQAIHERVAPVAEAPSDGGLRVRSIVTAGRERLADLVGGDARLEEALARLHQAGGHQHTKEPADGAAAPPPDEPRLRPTIDASPARAAAPVPPARPHPPDRPASSGAPSSAPSSTPSSAKSGDLLSSPAASAATTAFGRLADAMSDRTPAGERKLAETTREMLRPLLKDWLDEHLPRLVERLVREEIERVARTGR